ncbi:MAG: YtxH domain-containing protein [Ignavibacteria bacterium]|jgi:gas vesicle protein|nr:YtxH domain-containing protein [Ignavibacteria bacterium]
MQDQETNYKSFILGALVGGVIGALSALLFAPKSGKELRRDIADTSTDLYDRASDYVSQIVQDGKNKAQSIINTARHKADVIISDANDYKDSVQNRFDNLKDAAKAGAEAFKADLKKDN